MRDSDRNGSGGSGGEYAGEDGGEYTGEYPGEDGYAAAGPYGYGRAPEAYEEVEAAGPADPDVFLDVPLLEVDEIGLDVEDLRAHVSLQAEVLDLLRLNVGADVTLGRVNLGISGVRAQARLTVRLDNVATIINRVLTTIDRNPEILNELARGAGSAVADVGTGARRAVGELGAGAGGAVRDVGLGAGSAVRDVGRGAGEVVRDVGAGAGDVVRDVGAPVAEAGGGAVRTAGRVVGAAGDAATAAEAVGAAGAEAAEEAVEAARGSARPAGAAARGAAREARRRTAKKQGAAPARRRVRVDGGRTSPPSGGTAGGPGEPP